MRSAIVPSQPKQASLLQQFLNFAITPAEQKKGASLTFAPLPASVVAVDKDGDRLAVGVTPAE